MPKQEPTEWAVLNEALKAVNEGKTESYETGPWIDEEWLAAIHEAECWAALNEALETTR
jgi:hypothetical protein